MKETRLISRREFLKTISKGVLGITVAMNTPKGLQVHAQEERLNPKETEIKPFIQGHRGVDDDIRLMRFEPQQSPGVSKLNAMWEEQYETQEINTPAVIEGAFTLYGPAATAIKQLSLKVQEYTQSTHSSGRGQRIVALWNYLQENSLNDQIKTLGLSSYEFGQWFYTAIKNVGYDGVLATKSAADYGVTYDMWIWDNRIKQWRGKTEEKGYTFLVLDMATESTYWDKQDKTFNNLQLMSGQQNLSFGWLGDISTDFIADQLKIDASDQALIVRGVSNPFEHHHIQWPHYSEKTVPMNELYKQLGKRIQHIFSTPLFTNVIDNNTNQSDVFKMEVSGIDRVNQMNQGFWMASIFRKLNVPLVWEPIDSNEYKQWVTTETDPNNVGIPMGVLLQQQLFESWRIINTWKEVRANVNVPLAIPKFQSGIFALVDMPDHYNNELLVQMGFVVKQSDRFPELVWFDEDSSTVKRVELKNSNTYAEIFNNQQGIQQPKRVLKILY